MSGRAISAANRDELRRKVDAWWQRLQGACDRAELVAWVRRIEDRERELQFEEEPVPHVNTWDTFVWDLLHEQGLSHDEARARFVEACDLNANHILRAINLQDPDDPCYPMWSEDEVLTSKRNRELTRDFPVLFQEIVDGGLPRAVPRAAPDGIDLTPYEETGEWGGRSQEQGPFDVNEALYRLHYRRRVVPFWDARNRCRDATVAIVAVSEDGVTWRDPTPREAQGWDYQGKEIARYRAEHGDVPVNSWTREVEEARGRVKELRWEASQRPSEDVEERLAAAERELDRLRSEA